MLKSVIIKKIEDADGQSYAVGDRIRVLKKSESEFIGIIEEIYPDGFLLATAPDDKDIIKFDEIEKMRLAKPGENFFEHWNF